MSQRLVLGHVHPTSVDPPVTGWTRRPRRGGSSFLSGHSRDGLSLLACLLFGEQRLRRSRRQAGGGAIVKAPQNLYELLGVTDNADSDQIKKAYHDKMKICHPDIAGDDGEEICILLNDAYDLLSDPDEKKVYDEELNRANGNYKPVLYLEPGDLSPTWEWTSKNGNKKSKPEYKGRPLSRSLHHKVAPEDQGEKWTEEKFVFVDEWTCIACRNCCDVAPRTFCIDADAGRARVFAQWGNGEELLDYAVQACPVDCIYWVSRDELQVLEHVTRDRMFENGNTVPCSMAARQGTGGGLEDPFGMATKFQAKLAEEEERRKRMAEQGVKSASILEMQERIGELFGKLSERLRQAGWG